jgi:signal transduction histidine kinase
MGTHRRPSILGVGVAVVAVAASTLVIELLRDLAPVDALGVLYIPPVMLIAAGWGAGLGILTALGSALVYDYFYIPPVPSLAISGRRNLVTAITFLVSASMSGLVAALAARVRVAEERRRRVAEVRTRLMAAADDERRRVVRDMHDGAQQRLVHTVITLKLAGDALRREDTAAAEALVRDSLEYAEAAHIELRELAQGIMPVVLSRGGLAAAIESLVTRISTPVDVDVHTERHPSAIESTAYFIVAEALTNVVKHSRASHAEVRVSDDADELRIEVRDDGVGGAEVRHGTGLLGLDDRVSSLDGALLVHSPPGGGTRIVATLPLRGAAARDQPPEPRR